MNYDPARELAAVRTERDQLLIEISELWEWSELLRTQRDYLLLELKRHEAMLDEAARVRMELTISALDDALVRSAGGKETWKNSPGHCLSVQVLDELIASGDWQTLSNKEIARRIEDAASRAEPPITEDVRDAAFVGRYLRRLGYYRNKGPSGAIPYSAPDADLPSAQRAPPTARWIDKAD